MPLLIFIFAILFTLNGCSSTSRYSIDSYRQTKNELNKIYKLSRPDLIITYDLAKIHSTNCIYLDIFGLVANEKHQSKKYLQNFKTKYKIETLKKEAEKKVALIAKYLLKLQVKHHILTSKEEYYLKHILNNQQAIDGRVQLAKLDKITSTIPMMLPVYKPCFSSRYGNRKLPNSNKYKFHAGIDLAGINKAPLYSSANGMVTFVGSQNGYGNVVNVAHGHNIITKYAHLSKILVSKGQKIIRGQVIGTQGATGNARGEHLHFEIHIHGKHVNPYDFIEEEYLCKNLKQL